MAERNGIPPHLPGWVEFTGTWEQFQALSKERNEALRDAVDDWRKESASFPWLTKTDLENDTTLREVLVSTLADLIATDPNNLKRAQALEAAEEAILAKVERGEEGSSEDYSPPDSAGWYGAALAHYREIQRGSQLRIPEDIYKALSMSAFRELLKRAERKGGEK